MSLPWTWTILIRGQLEGVFVLAFVVEFEVGYNSFMHKTQPQKLLFIAFFSFFMSPTNKTPPPPQKQTPSESIKKVALKCVFLAQSRNV